jgi:hypothetical protein
MEPNMDIYPGLDLGLHNFGAHLGFRYFTDGFGLFGEAGVPIAKYDNITGFDHLNNQFVFNIGHRLICSTIQLPHFIIKRQFENFKLPFFMYFKYYKSNLIPCAKGKEVP